MLAAWWEAKLSAKAVDKEKPKKLLPSLQMPLKISAALYPPPVRWCSCESCVWPRLQSFFLHFLSILSLPAPGQAETLHKAGKNTMALSPDLKSICPRTTTSNCQGQLQQYFLKTQLPPEAQHQTEQPWCPALPTQHCFLLPISTLTMRKSSPFAKDRNSSNSYWPASCFPKPKQKAQIQALSSASNSSFHENEKNLASPDTTQCCQASAAGRRWDASVAFPP